MSGNFLVNEFRQWVAAKGIAQPSYKIIERLEKRTFTKVDLTKRQKLIEELAAEFRKGKEAEQPVAQAA